MRIATQKSAPTTRRAFGFARSNGLLWFLILVFAGWFCWRVIGYGYLPDDDALRHAAKAISGKSWGEILILRPEISIDHNPGWHWVLGLLKQITHASARGLVIFSIVALFLGVLLAPSPWISRPECWFASLAGAMCLFSYLPERLLLGRPLLITMGATLALLLLWREESLTKARLALSMALFAIAAWVHGSWYLLVLIPIAFGLARSWRKAAWLALCWLTGSVAGALLTGHPWTFLQQSASIPFLALGQTVPAAMLVREFEPFNGGAGPALAIGFMVALRMATGRKFAALIRDPVLCLAILGWVLGFRIARFWLDWGLPALVLWLALQAGEFLDLRSVTRLAPRAAIAAAAGLLLVFGPGSDSGARWSRYAAIPCLSAETPGTAEFLPAPGGTLYAVDMSVFYHTFFCNPHGNWRYAFGFEPTFMTPENLAVYVQLCVTRNAIRACAPWVQAMSPNDRLFLQGSPQIRPAIAELAWASPIPGLWVGRKPPAPPAKAAAGP